MASNIQVAITVDNKQYIAGVNAANSATQTFSKNTTKALDNISLGTNNLISRLGGLRTALTGLISATAVQQANNFANNIKDIATTADLTVESVLSLSRAFEVNGGTAEGAQNAILKFSETIGNAIAGSDSAQKSLKDVGISLKDIQNLSQQQLLTQAIKGIAGLESAAQRARVQTDLFGKAAKSVNFGGLTQQTPVNPAVTAAVESGAAASENMKRQFSQLTDAILLVAKPLNDIAKNINITAEAFASLIKAVLGAIAVYLIFAKAITAVNAFFTAFATTVTTAGGSIALVFGFITKQFLGMYAGLKAFFVNLGRVVGLFKTAYGGVASFGFALNGVIRAFLRFAGVAGIIYTVVQALDFLSRTILNFPLIDFLIEKFNKLIDVSKEFFGIKPTVDNDNGETQRMANRAKSAEQERKAREEAAAKAKEFAERQAKIRAEVEKTGEAFKKNNLEVLHGIEFETKMLSKTKEGRYLTENEVEVLRAQNDAYKSLRDQLDALLEKRKEYSRGTEEQRASLGIIDAEIAKVKKLGQVQIDALPKYIGDLQSAKMLEKDRATQIENMTRAMEQQLRIQEALSGARLSIISQGEDTAFARSQIGQGDLQKQIMSIGEANRKAGLEASRAFASAFEDGGDGLTSAQAQQLANGLDAIAQGYKNITAAQTANLNLSRTFGVGWSEAFQTYRDAAQNAAEQSKTYFDTFTKGFEDAFVKMVQTGKLSFKDLANSLIADFARIQAKKALLGIFDMGGANSSGSGFSFGTLFGSIGKLFGGFFANGGMPPVGKASIVGERGPELFVPKSAGTIVPAGQFGGGGNVTNVNYTISAVDASSFQSLLARNPEFIHNVAEQGRRSMPIRSRR